MQKFCLLTPNSSIILIPYFTFFDLYLIQINPHIINTIQHFAICVSLFRFLKNPTFLGLFQSETPAVQGIKSRKPLGNGAVFLTESKHALCRFPQARIGMILQNFGIYKNGVFKEQLIYFEYDKPLINEKTVCFKLIID